MKTPAWPLPEMTLRAPAAVPPTVLPFVPTKRPWLPFPSFVLPEASVPMKLPCTWFVFEDCSKKIPLPLQEMTLRDAGEVPPIWLFDELVTRTPFPLPAAAEPAASVPRKLPSTTLLPAVVRLRPPPRLNRLMTRPRTVLDPAEIVSPLAPTLCEVSMPAPDSSTSSTALSPSGSVFAEAPGCV